MHILALETSGSAGSVATEIDGRLLSSVTLDPGARSAQSLAPGIAQAVKSAGWRIKDIELIAVTFGPGSFTGLRVGLATAKTLAYALAARCVAVDTLEVIAAQAPRMEARLHVAMEAGRGELFAAAYEPAASDTLLAWRVAEAPALIARANWLTTLDARSAVTGPALAKLAGELPAGVTVVAQEAWAPRADTVARLAWHRHLAGAYDDAWKLVPLYLRKSAAEEKLGT